MLHKVDRNHGFLSSSKKKIFTILCLWNKVLPYSSAWPESQNPAVRASQEMRLQAHIRLPNSFQCCLTSLPLANSCLWKGDGGGSNGSLTPFHVKEKVGGAPGSKHIFVLILKWLFNVHESPQKVVEFGSHLSNTYKLSHWDRKQSLSSVRKAMNPTYTVRRTLSFPHQTFIKHLKLAHTKVLKNIQWGAEKHK